MKKNNCAFLDYVQISDYSEYPSAKSAGYKDDDDDFCIGQSGGILMKMDFIFIDVELFSKVGDEFRNSCSSVLTTDGRYCKYPKDTKLYKEFWARETQRRRKGMIRNCKLYKKDIPGYVDAITGKDKETCIIKYVNYLYTLTREERKKYLYPLRITGDHYNYLNYGKIMRTTTEDERKELDRLGKYKVKKIKAFPRFWDGDYWNFKIDEFIAFNGLHLCKGKARRKGYSFKRGSQSANTINLNRDITIILGAYDIKYLTKAGATTDMLKTNLDWYETHTYWSRGYLSEDLRSIELGYKKQKTGNKKYGYRSKALSETLESNPSALIGKDAIEVDIEEAGKCPNLQEVLNVTLSSTEAGELNTGTIRIYGTGGVKEADYKAFSDCFFNPSVNNMMAFENIWDTNSRTTTCGFFHPQIWNYEPYILHGNSLVEAAYEVDLIKKEDAAKNKNVSDWITYVGQRANSPSEAFRTGGENIFSSPELSNHLSKLKADSSLRYWRDGQLVRNSSGILEFKTNQQLLSEGVTVHPYIENVPFKSKDDVHGCIREYYPPFMVNGAIPDDLYYVVMDTIGKDKNVKELTVKNSLNGIYVLMYPNTISNSSGDIIVAGYVGRTNQMEDADRIADMLCERYNAKCLPEVDRGNTVANFRKWGKLHRLSRNPLSIIEEKLNINTNADYGITIGTGERKVDGLIYLKDWLYTQVSVNEETNESVYILHYIKDIPLLTELLIYNSTGNFDRVSTMIVAMYQRLAYRTLRKKASTVNNNGTTLLRSINLYGINK